MKLRTIIFAALASVAGLISAQEQSTSSAVLTRGSRTRPGQTETTTTGVSTRMQQQQSGTSSTDASLKYLRIIYRELDLEKEDSNAPLYFPEDLVDGNENLFRIMFRLLATNQIPAYEYLDGREEFTEEHRVKMADIISRFDLIATPAKGFSEKNPVYDFEPVDVPTYQVLSYFIIERWEFNNRENRMVTTVEAICPVIVRDESSSLAGKTPMFWMKMSDLKPYLQNQYIFIDDDNNLAGHTYDDYFTLNMYKGDIYKTRNLRNRTLAQMTGDDPDELKRAQDSIQNRLDHYADDLWVPSREELQAERERADSIAAAADTLNTSTKTSARSKRSKSSRSSSSEKTSKAKEPKKEKATKSSSSSSATRSVRNRRK